MRAHQDYLEVNTSSNTPGNPYKPGDKESHGSGLYCEYVINNQQELIVPYAPEDEAWCSNPDIKLGMVSYSGLPLLWPNGEVFGTICMLDSKANKFSETYLQLMSTFKDSIEAQLAVVFQQHKLLRLNHELQNRVENRTTDLAQLSYSLTKEIDRRKAAEKQVSYQKTHDQGTGFLNRSALEQVVEKSLQALKDDTQSLVIINIGFSNARSIQTRYGFEAFDEILKEFHSRLSERVSSFVTGRPSSNDLVLLVSGDDIESKLTQLLEEISSVSVGNFTIIGLRFTYTPTSVWSGPKEIATPSNCCKTPVMPCCCVKNLGKHTDTLVKVIQTTLTAIAS